MSFRTLAVCLSLLAAAGAASGCSRHAARQISSAPSASATGADFGRGRTVYRTQCAACHGERGIGGPIGPSLQKENVRHPYRWVYELVRDPAPPMPKLYPAHLNDAELRDVTAYVETL